MYRLTLLGLLLALATIFNFWIADDRLWAGICFLGSMSCFILHAAIQDLFRDMTTIAHFIKFGGERHG